MTRSLDPAVRPIPILQTINLVSALFVLAWEWPLGFLAGSGLHRSLAARLAALPLFALSAALIYQGTNAALYYVVAMVVYFWAYSEGEVSLPVWNYLLGLPNSDTDLLSDHLRQAVDSSPTRRERACIDSWFPGPLPSSRLRHYPLVLASARCNANPSPEGGGTRGALSVHKYGPATYRHILLLSRFFHFLSITTYIPRAALLPADDIIVPVSRDEDDPFPRLGDRKRMGGSEVLESEPWGRGSRGGEEEIWRPHQGTRRWMRSSPRQGGGNCINRMGITEHISTSISSEAEEGNGDPHWAEIRPNVQPGRVVEGDGDLSSKVTISNDCKLFGKVSTIT